HVCGLSRKYSVMAFIQIALLPLPHMGLMTNRTLSVPHASGIWFFGRDLMNADQITTNKPSAALVPATCYNGWLDKVLRINSRPVIKVYHGYGDNDRVLVLGHVLLKSPVAYEKYRRGFFHNSLSLLRLFMVKPAAAGIKIVIRLGDEVK